MALVNIKKSVEGYFSFVYDGDEANAIIDNAPNATAFGSIIHFKTKNGAPIFAQQNLTYLDVVYTDVSNTDFTFTSIQELYVKLIDEEFFKGLNQGSGSGATRFDALEDAFTYPGNDGKVPVVNSAQNKLDPVTFYNYKDFTELEDVAVDSLIIGKILSVALVEGEPKIVLTDANDDPVQLANVMGYLDYNDLATHTTPLTLVTNVEKKLTNDTLGAFTDISQRPYGVPTLWNASTNDYDFSYLTIGDTIDIRFDVTVTTTAANQRVRAYLRLAVGSGSQYDLTFFDSVYKTAGTYQITRYFGIYMGSLPFIENPADFYVITDASGSCVVNGWYNRIIRKEINLINLQVDEDIEADHYRGLWNASTNTPTLTNGVGQVGDWFKVSVGGTIFGRTWVAGDSIFYDNSDWVLRANNNQTAVLTSTVTSISSLNIATPNAKGLIDYINALPSSFSVGANEERFFLVTDTNQLFKLLLRNRSFGGTEPDIVESDIQTVFTDLTVTEKTWAQWAVPGIGTNAISQTGGGNVLVATGTVTAVTFSLDTKLASIPFVKATGTSGTNQSCGWKETSNFNVSLISGFDYCIIYAPDENTAGSRGFAGLYGSTGALLATTEPSSFGQYHVGLGHDSGDTNLSIIHNDSSGTSTKVALGANFPANDNTKAYLLRLTSYPVSSSANAVIYWKVVELISGNFQTGVITTDLPRNTVNGASSLTHVIWRNSAGNASSPIVKMSKIFFKRLN